MSGSEPMTHTEIALTKRLKERLSSDGKKKVVDDFGNEKFVDADVFTADQLHIFLCSGLEAVNQMPPFTKISFCDDEVMSISSFVVQYATVLALASKALVERGREFKIKDDGIAFDPPNISDILMTQYEIELNDWSVRIRIAKESIVLALQRESKDV